MKLILALAACIAAVSALNFRPIIGIMTEKSGADGEYIAASYIKHIEGAGGRAVPIHYKQSFEDLDTLFDSINGVLFPGGGMEAKPGQTYYDATNHIYKRAIAANDAGDYFPLWGTCLGFQFLAVMTADGEAVLESCDSENYTIPLNYTADAQQSRLLSAVPAETREWMQTLPITMNNHQSCVRTSKFASNEKLNSFYNVISTNVDRIGNEFVSTFEAKKYPFYGVQWHPEKNTYEWTPKEVIQHTFPAVMAQQSMANFFVNEARKNYHKFASEKTEETTLIYSQADKVVYTGPQGSSFTQEYIWN